jgi:drug/metabolite transporter (DMT)-like permease
MSSNVTKVYWPLADFLVALCALFLLILSSFIGYWGLTDDTSNLQVFWPAIFLYLISPILPFAYLLTVLILYLALVFYVQLNYFAYFVALLPAAFLLKKKFYWWFLVPALIHLSGLFFSVQHNPNLNYWWLFKQLSRQSLLIEYVFIFPLIWVGFLVNKLFLWFKAD